MFEGVKRKRVRVIYLFSTLQKNFLLSLNERKVLKMRERKVR